MHPPNKLATSKSPSVAKWLLLGSALLMALTALLFLYPRNKEEPKTTVDLGAGRVVSSHSGYRNRGLWRSPGEERTGRQERAMPTIKGVVYGNDGQELAGATVSAATFQLAGNLATTAKAVLSDERGRFELKLPDGSYHVSASKEGYGSTSTVLHSGDTASLVLAKSGVVEGHVYNERKEPVQNFTIDVVIGTPEDMAAPPPLFSKRFDSPDGSYRVDQFPDWPVSIRASSPDYASAFSPPVYATAGVKREIDLTLSDGCTLEGKVVDEQGEPLPAIFVDAEARYGAGSGAEVSVDGAKQGESDKAGNFRLEHVPTGTIALRGYDGVNAVTTMITEIASCDKLEPVKLVMSPGGSVSGVARTADGKPVAGARLMLMHRATGFVNTVSDKDGNFHFDKLPPGYMRIDLQNEGQHTTAFAEVKSGEESHLEITLPEAGQAEITGRVTAGNKPLPGLQIMVAAFRQTQGTMSLYYPVTDENGVYTVSNLPEGGYIVRIVSSSQATSLQVGAGEKSTADFDLQKPPEPPRRPPPNR